MDNNFKNQLINDFSISERDFYSKNNIFALNKPTDDFLFHNRSDFSLICTANKVFMRSSKPKLIEKLESAYKDYPGEWFAEASNIRKLSGILEEFDIEIDNFFPLMSYGNKKTNPRPYSFVRIEKEDIGKYKGKTLMSFCFDEDDRLGLAYYDGDSLIAVAGASYSGKYLWDIGLEKFNGDKKY